MAENEFPQEHLIKSIKGTRKCEILVMIRNKSQTFVPNFYPVRPSDVTSKMW